MASKVTYADAFPKILNDEETNKYFQLAKNGDENARKKLVEHNLRLVAYIINKGFSTVTYENPSIDIDDLMSTGTIGLMKAVDTFKFEEGFKFTTYASRCINNEILILLKKLKKLKNDIHIEDPISEDNNGSEWSFGSLLVSDEDIEGSYIQKEENEIVRDSLEILNDLERKVVELHYGFSGKRLTYSEIGELVGLSRSYVCILENKAIKKLEKHIVRPAKTLETGPIQREKQFVITREPKTKI